MSTMLDDKDKIIFSQLKENSRQTTKNISTKIKLPRVTVHDRIKKMIDQGIIKAFTTIPDYEKIGLPTKAFIFISFRSDKKISQRELAKRIAKLNGIFEVHIVSGEYDLLIKVRGTSLEEIGKLVVDKLRGLEGVDKTLTFACFETIKEEV
jgi:Lrp/AsnC family transcriptional regulator, leucine-responsive regulatory protein